MSNNQAENYMSECADMILRLYLVLLNKIKQDKAFEIYQDIDAPLIPILYHMEDAGILVDQTNLKELDVRFTERLNKLTQDIYTEAGEEFNINSPAQLGVILYEKRGLSGGKRGANGHWITDVKALENDTLAERITGKVKPCDEELAAAIDRLSEEEITNFRFGLDRKPAETAKLLDFVV